MSKVDITKLALPELHELMAEVENRAVELRKQALVEARGKIEDILAGYGFELDEVFQGGAKPVGRRSNPMKGKSVPEKYRNPTKPLETWSGRGKQPAWFRDALKRGLTEQDLLMK